MQDPIIPIVGEWVRQNPGVVSLGQGVVYYGPPPQAREQVERFFAGPLNHRYQAVQGIPDLVEAITAKLKAENNIEAESGESRAVVTAGGNMAFVHTVLAVADAGDEIILLTPFYFNHQMAIAMAGCRPVVVATDENYQPRLEALEAAITPRTRALLTVSPNNPSGAVYPEATLRAINALCARHGIYHISDEAYEYFTFDDNRHFSPGAIPGSAAHTISLFSLSKAYGFASWRIGYMVVPNALWTAIQKIQDTNLICPPVISQYAALGALSAGAAYCRDKLAVIGDVRRLLLDELVPLGDRIVVPPTQGAFYALLKVQRAGHHDLELVERLIREHGVAVLPGSAFGIEGDDGCLRVAFGSLPRETAAEGIRRLARGLEAVLA